MKNLGRWARLKKLKNAEKIRRFLVKKKQNNNTGIPDFELESLARMLLPKIQEMFKDEQVQKEFEEWKAKREANKLKK